MQVAPIPFVLPVAEVFDFVAKKFVQEEQDRLWSRAIRPDQPAATAPMPKQAYRPPQAHKKMREPQVDPKSRGNPEGAAKTKGRGTRPKQSAKEETPDAPTVSGVAAGETSAPGGAEGPGQPLQDGDPVSELAEARHSSGT